MRNFKFGAERYNLQFRLETFNTFNHPQWNGVNTFCADQSPDGGSCAGSGFGEVTSAYPVSHRAARIEICFLASGGSQSRDLRHCLARRRLGI